MKHPHRKLSWSAILDIVLVVLTVIVIILAILKAAGRVDAAYRADSNYIEQSVIMLNPQRQLREFAPEVYEPTPGFCNMNYSRSITFVEYQIAEIPEEVLLTIQAEQEESRMLSCEVESQITLTSDEKRMLASLVTLEVGSESYECQQAVASVVLNRMVTSNRSLKEVIYEKYQFSVASSVASTEPQKSCIDAVEEVLRSGTTLPTYVTFFRAGHYHDWGDRYISYAKIDRTYFSYDTKLKEKWSI